MSIEIGSKWFKDGEVVVIREIGKMGNIDCIMYSDGVFHALTMCDFLEQYKPYEVVYEYKYAYPLIKDYHEIIIVQNVYLTDEQMEKSGTKEYQRLDFTKRERKQ